MKLHSVILLTLLLQTNVYASLDSANPNSIPSSSGSNNNIQIIDTPKLDNNRILEILYTAASAGEIVVLDVVIQRENIKPVSVALIYNLQGSTTMIRVVSRIEPAVTVPHIQGMFINKISTEIDLNGSIVSTTAHCEM